MGEITLTVPGKYVEFFQLGVLNEIETDCGSLIDNAQEMAAKVSEWKDADVQSAGRLLGSDLSVLAQLAEVANGKDVSIVAPPDGCLEHAAAATARSVIGPRLQEKLKYAPMEEGESEKIHALTDALSWATKAAADCCAERVAAAEAAEQGEEA